MEKKNIFEKPEAILVSFEIEDIILTSTGVGWQPEPGDHDSDPTD